MSTDAYLITHYEDLLLAYLPADAVDDIRARVELRAKLAELQHIQNRKATQARARKRAKEKAETDALIRQQADTIAALEAQVNQQARTIARLDAHIALFDRWVGLP